MALTNQATLTIVTTGRGADKSSEAVTQAMKAMAREFGGVTVTDAQGAWVDASGELVIDSSKILSSWYGDEHGDSIHGKMSALARYVKEFLDEDAVLYTVNTAAYFQE